MSRIYLSLGTNLGEKEKNIEHALRLLLKEVKVRKTSSLYETEPVGFKDQPWFLNMVLEGDTGLSAEELLRFVKGIESEMKRVKTMRNGPRIIDIDILLYEDERIETEELTVPHPRMLQRAFVMVPLNEISPDLVISGQSIKDIMKNFKGEAVFERN
jgi:2-amino-4-hydroxy-6-hydroxymethyldihydropteridine diphosphokinase